MKIIFFKAALGLLLVFGSISVQAIPITDQVYGCNWNTSSGGCPLDVPNPGSNWFVIFGPNDTATPGPGYEFIQAAGSLNLTLDIGDGTVDITYSCTSCGTADYEFAITGIDSVNITGLSLVYSGGLPFVSSSFTSNSMRMSFSNASPGGTRTASFIYTATGVPEPSTALLLIGGLAVLSRRRAA